MNERALMVDQITREKNAIQAHTLSEPSAVGAFFAEMQAAFNENYRQFVIDFCNVEKAFPNVATPIAGAVQFYENQRQCKFEFTNVSESVRRAWIVEPRQVSDFGTEVQTSPMNTVWCFTSSADVNRLTNGFVAAVAQAAVCGAGALDALDWSINEVMDNVLQHSLVDRGFVMGQIHRNSTRVAICVFDYGQGIFKSLKGSTICGRPWKPSRLLSGKASRETPESAKATVCGVYTTSSSKTPAN